MKWRIEYEAEDKTQTYEFEAPATFTPTVREKKLKRKNREGVIEIDLGSGHVFTCARWHFLALYPVVE